MIARLKKGLAKIKKSQLRLKLSYSTILAMDKKTRTIISSLFSKAALAGFASILLCALVTALPIQARRAYSYADMYSPQQTEEEVVKPKKKPRKPKSKPISVQVQKPIAKETTNRVPDTDLPVQKNEISKGPEIEAEIPKPKKLESKSVLTPTFEERKSSPDLEKARKITLEELLGKDVVKGMSSK